jgi:hypothetical protein
MRTLFLIGLLASTIACAGDAVGGEGEGEGEGEDSCTAGCELTLAAECPEGPASQAECVTDCEALRIGDCGTEYESLLTCGESSEVACDENDIPTVVDCAAEEGVFRDCIGG